MKSEAVVFIGQVYPQGLVRHLAYLGVELWGQLNGETPFYFASVAAELDKGGWGIVEEVLPKESIIKEPDFPSVLSRVAEIAERCDKIVLHCGGGLRQMRYIIPLKKRFKDKMRLVVTTHSFRHGTWKRYPMAVVQAWLYSRYVDMVIFQCPYAARLFIFGKRLFEKGKACIIPLGCESVEVAENIPSSVTEMGLAPILTDDGVFKFVYLAGFGKVKNHDWLIRAVEPVMKRNPAARLLLLGPATEERRKDLSEQIKAMGLENQIITPGKVPRIDVPWVLKHCDCAVVPSKSETFGHTFVEPMMYGIPVLGTRVGVGEYAIQDYQTGICFSLGAYDSIRNAMEFVMKSKDRTRRMGERASELASGLFTHRRVAIAHVAMYRQLLEGVQAR